MNYSRQRELIRKTIAEHPVHPTADELLALVRLAMPDIGLATVYRNLKLLAADGSILRVPVPAGPEHFDGNTLRHFHLYCTQCGRVFDVAHEAEPDFSALIKSCPHKILDSTVLFTGICEDCDTKQHS